MKKCKYCHKDYILRDKRQINTQKYCSNLCRIRHDKEKKEIKRRSKINKVCIRCNKKREYYSSRLCDKCRRLRNIEITEYHKTNSRKKSLLRYNKIKNNPDYLIRRNKYFKMYDKKRRMDDKNYNISRRLRNLLTNALIKYSMSGKAGESVKYGISYKKIIEHLKPFPEDISKYHIDHIKPLCSFNLEDKEQIKKAFAPENHRWLLAKDNLKKAKYDLVLSLNSLRKI